MVTDGVAPFGFSWDSNSVANGSQTLTLVALDAAGNSTRSAGVTINVANAVLADTAPPTVAITNPMAGTKVAGNVNIRVSASDNAGLSGITQTLWIDGKKVATATGGSLSFNWNTKKAAAGGHTIQAVAADSAGNQATATVSVTR
jgi:hypothetical protein